MNRPSLQNLPNLQKFVLVSAVSESEFFLLSDVALDEISSPVARYMMAYVGPNFLEPCFFCLFFELWMEESPSLEPVQRIGFPAQTSIFLYSLTVFGVLGFHLLPLRNPVD